MAKKRYSDAEIMNALKNFMADSGYKEYTRNTSAQYTAWSERQESKTPALSLYSTRFGNFKDALMMAETWEPLKSNDSFRGATEEKSLKALEIYWAHCQEAHPLGARSIHLHQYAFFRLNHSDSGYTPDGYLPVVDDVWEPFGSWRQAVEAFERHLWTAQHGVILEPSSKTATVTATVLPIPSGKGKGSILSP